MECSYKKCCHYCTVSLVPVTSIILAIVFLGGFVALPIVFSTATVRTQYGLVIDAGSSHTSLFVYSWDVNNNGTGLVRQVFTSYTNNPLTGYAAYPSYAGPNVSQLVERAEPYVKGDLSYVQLFLGATAGMRLLRDTNPTATSEILQSITSSLQSSSPYSFVAAEVINGTEEGLYAWVTLNYLSKKVPQGPDTTSGVLDMGGASLQIASEYKGGPVPPGCNLTSVTLFGRGYSLFSCSYLCYGRDRAESHLLDDLINSQPNVSVITNPCFPVNYSHTYMSSEIYDGDCVKAGNGTASSYSFIGTGNSTECQDLLATVFNTTVQSDVITIQGNFIGISTFYYAASSVYKTSAPLPISSNLSSYNSTVFKFCNTPLHSPSNSSRIGDACFNGMYTLFMLQNVLGFSKATDWTLSFNITVNGEDIGWSLGYMLNRTAALDDHITLPFLVADLAVGMIVLAILCVVFVAFFIFTFVPCRKAIKHNNGYSSLS